MRAHHATLPTTRFESRKRLARGTSSVVTITSRTVTCRSNQSLIRRNGIRVTPHARSLSGGAICNLPGPISIPILAVFILQQSSSSKAGSRSVEARAAGTRAPPFAGGDNAHTVERHHAAEEEKQCLLCEMQKHTHRAQYALAESARGARRQGRLNTYLEEAPLQPLELQGHFVPR